VSLAPFDGFFRGRRVLLTGHTGFKGAWLSHWLLDLGAEVTGLGLAPEGDDSLFEVLDLEQRLKHHVQDLRDAEGVARIVRDAAPEVVLHLAAQALVRRSFAEPKATWDINVGGTVNILEAVRQTESVRSCVIVSTDKCYENQEWERGYREDDRLGGHDAYSASKAGVELVVASYRKCFLPPDGRCRLASARAGNVIGGGDRAEDRLVVDFVKSLRAGEPLVLRNPTATRPWQHVLEPLSGYLQVAAELMGDDGATLARAWNFGPEDAAEISVEALAEQLVESWGDGKVETDDSEQPHEAGRLQLDSGLARTELAWRAVWGVPDAVSRTVEWYRAESENVCLKQLTSRQLVAHQSAATELGLRWAASTKGVADDG
jgi:CDP-glucose 4,6-dehydratase